MRDSRYIKLTTKQRISIKRTNLFGSDIRKDGLKNNINMIPSSRIIADIEEAKPIVLKNLRFVMFISKLKRVMEVFKD